MTEEKISPRPGDFSNATDLLDMLLNNRSEVEGKWDGGIDALETQLLRTIEQSRSLIKGNILSANNLLGGISDGEAMDIISDIESTDIGILQRMRDVFQWSALAHIRITELMEGLGKDPDYDLPEPIKEAITEMLSELAEIITSSSSLNLSGEPRDSQDPYDVDKLN